MVSLAERRRGAEHLEAAFSVSERRACQMVSIARSTKRRSSGGPDVELLARIHELSREYPRFGSRKIFFRLRHEGWKVGRETVRLLRKREGLQVPQKQRDGVGAERAPRRRSVRSTRTTCGATTSCRTRQRMRRRFVSSS
jgi:putative transposase